MESQGPEKALKVGVPRARNLQPPATRPNLLRSKRRSKQYAQESESTDLKLEPETSIAKATTIPLTLCLQFSTLENAANLVIRTHS